IYYNSILTSLDYGTNLIHADQSSADLGFGTFTACSADGSRMCATASSGNICVSRPTAAPILHTCMSGDKAQLVWSVPSTNYVLQQVLDVGSTNWQSVLTLTSFFDQITLAPSNSKSFYRLKRI